MLYEAHVIQATHTIHIAVDTGTAKHVNCQFSNYQTGGFFVVVFPTS